MSTIFERIQTDCAKFVDPTIFGQAAAFGGESPYEESSGYEASSLYNGGASINVLFAGPTSYVDPLDGVTRTAQPSALARKTDVVNPQKNDTLTIDGTTYYVTNWQEAGLGMWKLDLTEDAA